MQNHDEINNPAHYTHGGIETIDYIQAKLTQPEFIGFLRANIIKYVTRAPLKGSEQDYKKAQFYLDRLIKLYQ